MGKQGGYTFPLIPHEFRNVAGKLGRQPLFGATKQRNATVIAAAEEWAKAASAGSEASVRLSMSTKTARKDHECRQGKACPQPP